MYLDTKCRIYKDDIKNAWSQLCQLFNKEDKFNLALQNKTSCCT